MKLLFEDCVIENQILYFICRDYNVLAKLDISTGKIDLIDSIPEESIFSWRLGSKIIYWKDKLYFAPMNANKIWKYDLQKNTWNGYERKVLDNWTSNMEMFQAILYGEKIFFLGSNYPAIIVFDLATEELEYITEPYDTRKDIAKNENDCWFRTDYVLKNNILLMASCVDNKVFQFNLDTYDFDYIAVGKDEYKYAGIDWDGHFFYLAPRKDGPLIIWDGKKIKEIDFKSENDLGMPVFGGVFNAGNEVIFSAAFCKNTIILSKTDNDSITKIEKQYLFYKRINDDTIVSLEESGIIEIDCMGNRYRYTTEVSDAVLGKYIKEKMLEHGEALKGLENETKEIPLGIYLHTL